MRRSDRLAASDFGFDYMGGMMIQIDLSTLGTDPKHTAGVYIDRHVFKAIGGFGVLSNTSWHNLVSMTKYSDEKSGLILGSMHLCFERSRIGIDLLNSKGGIGGMWRFVDDTCAVSRMVRSDAYGGMQRWELRQEMHELEPSFEELIADPSLITSWMMPEVIRDVIKEKK